MTRFKLPERPSMPPSTNSRFSNAHSKPLCAVALALCTVLSSWGQGAATSDTATELEQKIKNLPMAVQNRLTSLKIVGPFKEEDRESIKNALTTFLSPEHQVALYSLILASPWASSAVKSFKTDVDEARVDKQIGSSSTSSG